MNSKINGDFILDEMSALKDASCSNTNLKLIVNK